MKMLRLFVEDRLATVGAVYHMVYLIPDIDARCSSHEKMLAHTTVAGKGT